MTDSDMTLPDVGRLPTINVYGTVMHRSSGLVGLLNEHSSVWTIKQLNFEILNANNLLIFKVASYINLLFSGTMPDSCNFNV